ncbi:hypothetical protein ALP29_200483 [Pseudomonas syringae pv. avii]|uniref:Uncharacterized protein n=1 Tax=Pseudomonas syringae pv. avii TaxID=663959 RepID=A0A3M5V184_PSESX|nr:hypothetical protein ALP29_200483 [Pseudomonas syringae pv. avii]
MDATQRVEGFFRFLRNGQFACPTVCRLGGERQTCLLEALCRQGEAFQFHPLVLPGPCEVARSLMPFLTSLISLGQNKVAGIVFGEPLHLFTEQFDDDFVKCIGSQLQRPFLQPIHRIHCQPCLAQTGQNLADRLLLFCGVFQAFGAVLQRVDVLVVSIVSMVGEQFDRAVGTA